MGVKPSLDQHVERVAFQGQFQQHGVVLEEIESVAGDLGPPLEIEQSELFAQFDVIERLEIELGRCVLAAADFQVGRVVGAARRVGMRQVGNRLQDSVRFGG